MTSAIFNNVQANAAVANSSTIRTQESKKKEETTFSFGSSDVKGKGDNPLLSLDDIDTAATELEEKNEKANSGVRGFFGKALYDWTTKNDEIADEAMDTLKDNRNVFAKDGVIDNQELVQLNKDLKEAQDASKEYRHGQADRISTVAAGAAGVIAAGSTGGLGTTAAAAGAKVLTKELLLGDEYDALGKDGIKDAATVAVWSAGGAAVGAATKTAGLATKIGANVIKDQACMLATSEAHRELYKNGDVGTIAKTMVLSAATHTVASKIKTSSKAGDFVKGQSLTTGKQGMDVAVSNVSRALMEGVTNNAAEQNALAQ